MDIRKKYTEETGRLYYKESALEFEWDDDYVEWLEQNLVKLFAIPDVSSSLPPDVAEKILKARDAFVEKDYNEVWHWLYSIASPNYDKTEPWKDLERIAGRL